MIHERAERNVGLLIVLIVVAVSIGGIVEIFPMFLAQRTPPIVELTPFGALELEGRDVYIREGCHVCHTQMVRALRAEAERYGHYSMAGEDVYEHPFLWGSKRTGPDLARIGKRYSDDWHRAHLADPRAVVPQSNMPAYPWLFDAVLTGDDTAAKQRVLRTLGVPYTDDDIAQARSAVEGRTEADALIAYLQSLGIDMAEHVAAARRVAAASAGTGQ
jgi:cytochrome c oxidase cbb3-type subunit II